MAIKIAVKIISGVVSEAIVVNDSVVPAGYTIAPDGVGIGYVDNGGGSFSPPVVAPVVATVADYTQAVQNVLDTQARTSGYDNIFTAVTYADEPAVATFQAQGQALRAWRSLTWAACYEVLADVESGARAMPTVAELLTELPAYGG